MDDLVVAERQDEVLGERVHEAERQLVVVVGAVDRILGEVLQGVVHPAHVPLEAEAEPAEVGRARDAGPRGRLLGRRDHARLLGVQQLVGLLQERDRVEVLATAERVRHPLAGLPRVVEVQHRGDRVDPDAVGVELATPVERAREQEVAHLGAAEVEDERAPVRMLAALAGRRARTAREPSKRASAHSSFGKCAGTQSRITPRPRWWRRSTKCAKSSGEPKRESGAK